MAQAPFQISPALVAIANDYSAINRTARGYIADIVCPRVRVEAPLFEYPEYKLEDAFTVYDNQIDRLGQLNEITESSTMSSGKVIDYGILSKIPYRDELAAQSARIPFTLKTRAVRKVIDTNQLNREIRVANLMFSAANYQAGYKTTLSGTSQFTDYNNSDPVALALKIRRDMLIPPNVAIMSQGVRDALALHPKVSVALGGSANSGRIATNEELARVLGVERIVIGNTLRQTSKRGQNLTTGYIWGNNIAFVYVPPTGPDGLALGIESPAFAATFQWNGNIAGENPYRPGEMGLYGGVGVYAGESLVEKQIAPFAGYLITDAIPTV